MRTARPDGEKTQHNHRRFFEYIPTLVIIDNSILCGSPFTGIFSLREKLWRRELMSKRASRGIAKKACPMTEEATPPPLSKKLIAQLQGAVKAAQRKRLADPGEAPAGQS